MAITSGYAHMWPREIFDARVRSENGKKVVLARTVEFLVSNPGVYVLYRNETPHYIGKSDARLYNRIWAHANQPRDKYYHFWTHFSAFAVNESAVRVELEGILIATMPTANSAEPKLQKENLPTEVAKLMRLMRHRNLRTIDPEK